jgi:hypothetical protein
VFYNQPFVPNRRISVRELEQFLAQSADENIHPERVEAAAGLANYDSDCILLTGYRLSIHCGDVARLFWLSAQSAHVVACPVSTRYRGQHEYQRHLDVARHRFHHFRCNAVGPYFRAIG